MKTNDPIPKDKVTTTVSPSETLIVSIEQVQKALAHHQSRMSKIDIAGLTSPDSTVRGECLSCIKAAVTAHQGHHQRSVNSGLQVGVILLLVKEQKMHLKKGAEADHPKPQKRAKKVTFATYAKEQFGIGQSYAHRLMVLATQWLYIAEEPVQPSSLDSLRALKQITTKEDKIKAWSQAVSTAKDSAPSAKEVQAAVRTVMGVAAPQRASKAAKVADAPEAQTHSLFAKEIVAIYNTEGPEKALERVFSEAEETLPVHFNHPKNEGGHVPVVNDENNAPPIPVIEGAPTPVIEEASVDSPAVEISKIAPKANNRQQTFADLLGEEGGFAAKLEVTIE